MMRVALRQAAGAAGLPVGDVLAAQMDILRLELVSAFRQECPVDTNPGAEHRHPGRIRNSIRAEIWHRFHGIAKTRFRALYRVNFILHRTRSHEIFAKRARAVQATGSDFGAFVFASRRPRGRSHGSRSRSGAPVLVFSLGGRVIRSAHVHHPGTHGNDFVDRALVRVTAAWRPIFRLAMKNAIANQIRTFI